jgi:hypothetical protein
MKGAVFVSLLLITVAAHARELPLPVPPIPPAEQPAMAAPVPDLTILEEGGASGSYRVTLFSGINHRSDPATGLAYAPGARYQLDNDRRFMLPGVMVHVPLP